MKNLVGLNKKKSEKKNQKNLTVSDIECKYLMLCYDSNLY